MLVRDGSHIGHVSESASTFVVPVFLGDGLLLAFEGWWAGSTGGRARPSRSGRSGASPRLLLLCTMSSAAPALSSSVEALQLCQEC